MPAEPTASTRRATWSVRVRILAVILLLSAIGLAVGGGSIFLLLRERILADVDDRLHTVVAGVELIVLGDAQERPGTASGVEVVAPSGQHTNAKALLTTVMRSLVLHHNESTVGLLDGTLALVPSAGSRDFFIEDDPALIPRFVEETASGDIVIGTAVSTVGTIRYVAVPMRVEGDTQQAIYVSAIDLDAELELLDVFRTYAIIATGALVLTGLAGWLVAGRLLRPIRMLRTTAERITITDLAERIPVRGSDDVSQLTVTMNAMLDRLQASVTAQQHLLDDVRHELGTPITIVRGHLELMDPDDPTDVAQVRSLALDEVDRMGRLLDDIQLLAGSGAPAVHAAATDIGELTRQVFDKASALSGHDWRLAAMAAGSVRVDAQRITQAWLQLADNAAKYSPAGGVIELGSRWLGEGAVELWVRDEGPGIPADSRARIFERFGRVDPGRGIRGSGLGLPIVAAIAAAHGGRVELRTEVGEGARFALVLPGLDDPVQLDDPVEPDAADAAERDETR